MNDMQKTPISTDARLNSIYGRVLAFQEVLKQFNISVEVMVTPSWATAPQKYPDNYFQDAGPQILGHFQFHVPGTNENTVIEVGPLMHRIYESGKNGIEIAQILFEVFNISAINVPTWLFEFEELRNEMSYEVMDMVMIRS